MLELILRGSWEALRSLNKEIPCYGLTSNFLVGRQVGPQVGAMLKLVLGGFLERSWEGFRGVLETSWGCIGASWGRLGASWGVLAEPGARFSRPNDAKLKHSIMDAVFELIFNRFWL